MLANTVQKFSNQVPLANRELLSLQALEASHGFAYLFDKFPTWGHTFCFREVAGMIDQGLQFPILSITVPRGEPRQDIPTQLMGRISYMPENIKLWAKKERWRTEKWSFTKVFKERWQDKKIGREVAWLRQYFLRNKVNHIHLHFTIGNSTRLAHLLKKMVGIRYSVTAHADDFWANLDENRVGELRRIFHEAEFIATETDFSVKWLSERFPDYAHKIHRVYNGIFTNRFFVEKKNSLKPT